MSCYFSILMRNFWMNTFLSCKSASWRVLCCIIYGLLDTQICLLVNRQTITILLVWFNFKLIFFCFCQTGQFYSRCHFKNCEKLNKNVEFDLIFDHAEKFVFNPISIFILHNGIFNQKLNKSLCKLKIKQCIVILYYLISIFNNMLKLH